MRKTRIGYALCAATAAALLAACSSGGSPIAPTGGQNSVTTQSISHHRLTGDMFGLLPKSQHGLNLDLMLARYRGAATGRQVNTQGFMSRDAVRKPLLFLVDSNNGVVYAFLQAKGHKAVGQITGLTQLGGAATGTTRNLYLTSASSVLVFAPPYTGTPTILQDTGSLAFTVAVSPKGVVGIANACTLPSCPVNTGSVTFYAPNSTVPCATIAVDAAVGGAAFDSEEHFFFAGIHYPAVGQGTVVIGKVVGGCNAKTSTPLTTANTIAAQGGLHVDKANRIAISDTGYNIYTYNQPKHGALGNPVSTTTLTTPNAVINDFAFVASGANLYSAEIGVSNPGFSNEYDYPAGGPPEGTVEITGNGGPVILSGVAVTPPLVP